MAEIQGTPQTPKETREITLTLDAEGNITSHKVILVASSSTYVIKLDGNLWAVRKSDTVGKEEGHPFIVLAKKLDIKKAVPKRVEPPIEVQEVAAATSVAVAQAEAPVTEIPNEPVFSASDIDAFSESIDAGISDLPPVQVSAEENALLLEGLRQPEVDDEEEPEHIDNSELEELPDESPAPAAPVALAPQSTDDYNGSQLRDVPQRIERETLPMVSIGAPVLAPEDIDNAEKSHEAPPVDSPAVKLVGALPKGSQRPEAAIIEQTYPTLRGNSLNKLRENPPAEFQTLARSDGTNPAVAASLADNGVSLEIGADVHVYLELERNCGPFYRSVRRFSEWGTSTQMETFVKTSTTATTADVEDTNEPEIEEPDQDEEPAALPSVIVAPQTDPGVRVAEVVAAPVAVAEAPVAPPSAAHAEREIATEVIDLNGRAKAGDKDLKMPLTGLGRAGAMLGKLVPKTKMRKGIAAAGLTVALGSAVALTVGSDDQGTPETASAPTVPEQKEVLQPIDALCYGRNGALHCFKKVSGGDMKYTLENADWDKDAPANVQFAGTAQIRIDGVTYTGHVVLPLGNAEGETKDIPVQFVPAK